MNTTALPLALHFIWARAPVVPTEKWSSVASTRGARLRPPQVTDVTLAALPASHPAVMAWPAPVLFLRRRADTFRRLRIRRPNAPYGKRGGPENRHATRMIRLSARGSPPDVRAV